MMRLRKAALGGCTIAFVCIPIWSFVVEGPFKWHVQQPEAWQGLLELCLLFAALYAGLSLGRRPLSYAIFLAACFVYTRRHGVDISLALAYFYFQGVFGLGWLVTRKWPTTGSVGDRSFISFFAGVVVWSALLWGISILGLGSLENIRVVSLVVLTSSIMFSGAPQLAGLLSPWKWLQSSTLRFSASLLSVVFLMLFAKMSSMAVINYDSMWYGLQLEKCMVGEGSIFTNQGLVALVHYYPKVYEVILLPLSGFKSISFLMSVGAFFWVALVATCYALLRECDVNAELSALVISVLATVPAVANSALATKGDLFAAWLGMLSLLFFLRGIKSGEIALVLLGFCALFLSPLGRLSMLPFVPFPLLLGIYAFLQCNAKATRTALSTTLPVVIATLVVIAAAVGRTIELTGVPFIAPGQLLDIAGRLGMEVQFPAGLPPSEAGRKTLPLVTGLWSYAFAPHNLSIQLITWIGNAWLFFPVAVVFLWSSQRCRAMPIVAALLATGFSFVAVLLFMKVGAGRGADGNYFIFPIACLLVGSGILLNDQYASNARVLRWLFGGFAAASAVVCLVTGNWGPGTKVWDWNFSRGPFELKATEDFLLRDKDRDAVHRLLAPLPDNTRVAGLYAGEEKRSTDARLFFGWMLPVRYEPLEIVSWSRPEIIRSSDVFRQYLEKSRIQFVLLPQGFVRPENSSHAVCKALLEMTSKGAATKVLSNATYEVWQTGDSIVAVTASKPGRDQAETASAATAPSDVSAVAGWGPQSTKAGKAFNVQPDGESAMWIRVQGLSSDRGNYIQFGEVKITRLLQKPDLVTFAVPASAYATAGDQKIRLFEAATGRWIDVGVFKVLPAQ